MKANDFVKFLEVTLKIQKDAVYCMDTDLQTGVYIHQWGDALMLMSMNGHEMIFEKIGTIQAGDNMCGLAPERLEAMKKLQLFPCKITRSTIVEHVLPLAKAFKSKINSAFFLLDFVPDAEKSDRAIIKANIFGRDIDIPVMYISEDSDSGFMMLYRTMVVRDETMGRTDQFLLAHGPSSNINIQGLTNICAWFSGHKDPQPKGMIIQPWDIRDTDKKLRPNHVLIWPAHEDSIETSPYGVVSMQMRLKETCQE